LTKLGFEVVAAANGEQGLALAAQIRPTLITLDVVMPGVDGWGVLKSLKSDSELARIPVIMVTVVDNETGGINLGASGYLVKPVDRDRLVGLIEEHRPVHSASGPEPVSVGAERSERSRKSPQRNSHYNRSN
jgi:DNA-binding response OmpR family regulator